MQSSNISGPYIIVLENYGKQNNESKKERKKERKKKERKKERKRKKEEKERKEKDVIHLTSSNVVSVILCLTSC